MKKNIFLSLALASTVILQAPAYSFPFFTDKGGFTGTLRQYKEDFLDGNFLNLIKKGIDCCIVISGKAKLGPPVEPPPPPPPPLPPIDIPLVPIPPTPPDQPGFSLGIGPWINPEDPSDIGIFLGGIWTFSPPVFGSFEINDNSTTIVNGEFEVLDFLDGKRGGVINFATGEAFFGNEAFSQGEGLDLNGRSYTVNNVAQQQADCRVPEPSTVLSLLAFSILGLGSALKRKLKSSI